MSRDIKPTHSAFHRSHRLVSGTLAEVVRAAKQAAEQGMEPLLLCDHRTGELFDLDARGTEHDMLARLPAAAHASQPRGRPKLGVIAREVTLLPRHWDWLNAHPGGASVALRRLVEEARLSGRAITHRNARHEAAYRFMSRMAGDLAGFEEAARALFAHREDRLREVTSAWPPDIRQQVMELAFVDDESSENAKTH
jgi:hypothetical protein